MIIFINGLLIAQTMFTPVKDGANRLGMYAGFSGSVILLISIFSLVTLFTAAITPVRVVTAGVVFAVVLVGGGALLRRYLR